MLISLAVQVVTTLKTSSIRPWQVGWPERKVKKLKFQQMVFYSTTPSSPLFFFFCFCFLVYYYMFEVKAFIVYYSVNVVALANITFTLNCYTTIFFIEKMVNVLLLFFFNIAIIINFTILMEWNNETTPKRNQKMV